jgi:hypothetical protein
MDRFEGKDCGETPRQASPAMANADLSQVTKRAAKAQQMRRPLDQGSLVTRPDRHEVKPWNRDQRERVAATKSCRQHAEATDLDRKQTPLMTSKFQDDDARASVNRGKREHAQLNRSEDAG